MIAKRGFTIIELLVVIGILAVIAALVVGLGGKAQESAHKAACLGNLRNIGTGFESYLGDHNFTFPILVSGRSTRNDPGPTLEMVLADYVDEDAFNCPADKKDFAASGSSYLWNSTQNGLRNDQLNFFGNGDQRDAIPLVTDKEAYHGEKNGTNILYASWSASDDVRFTVDR